MELLIFELYLNILRKSNIWSASKIISSYILSNMIKSKILFKKYNYNELLKFRYDFNNMIEYRVDHKNGKFCYKKLEFM